MTDKELQNILLEYASIDNSELGEDRFRGHFDVEKAIKAIHPHTQQAEDEELEYEINEVLRQNLDTKVSYRNLGDSEVKIKGFDSANTKLMDLIHSHTERAVREARIDELNHLMNVSLGEKRTIVKETWDATNIAKAVKRICDLRIASLTLPKSSSVILTQTNIKEEEC